ncbi:hypothetical protein B0H10DRAFT_2211605 [Mycena sp. CBHHK59/15]|nr:hypothetical protein B0H10DRAFT_2211605 [Mycena sp. CBHHK59/15]
MSSHCAASNLASSPQHYVKLEEIGKNRKLNELLDTLEFNQVVIFVKSVARANELDKFLVSCNFPSTSIDSGHGIDVEGVNIVINYDCPQDADSYLHRVRHSSLAVTFVSSDNDQEVMAMIQSQFTVAVPELPDHIDPATYSKGKAQQIEPDEDADEDYGSDSHVGSTKQNNRRNPSGKNQYAPTPKLADIANLLQAYHKNNHEFKYADYIAALAKDHAIKISRTKLAKYLSKLGLSTSSRGNCMPDAEQRQLILDELALDPLQTRGPRTVREALELDGHKIGRGKIGGVMHDFEDEGFSKRHPHAKKKLFRTPLTSVGPNEEWSMDGHDKLNNAGFGIYGIRDKWSGNWLHYRVVPSNRYAAVVGVLFLECVKKHGGQYSITCLYSG